MGEPNEYQVRERTPLHTTAGIEGIWKRGPREDGKLGAGFELLPTTDESRVASVVKQLPSKH